MTQKIKPEKFAVPAETLTEIRRLLLQIRDETNDRAQWTKSKELLSALTHLEPISSPKDAFHEFVYKEEFMLAEIRRRKKELLDAQTLSHDPKHAYAGAGGWGMKPGGGLTDASSLVGKRVRRIDEAARRDSGGLVPLEKMPVGIILRELITGEVIVDFTGSGGLSSPLHLKQLEILGNPEDSQ